MKILVFVFLVAASYLMLAGVSMAIHMVFIPALSFKWALQIVSVIALVVAVVYRKRIQF